jgi:hypothetical protein
MGLYGAVKLSVASKSLEGEPQVTAELMSGEVATLKLTVLAFRQSTGLVINTIGLRGGAEVLLGKAKMSQDGTGTIDKTIVFPLGKSQWSELSVKICRPDHCRNKQDEVARLTSGLPLAAEHVSGSLLPATDTRTLLANISASGIAPSAQVEVAIFRHHARRSIELLRAVVEPAADGSIAWSSTIAPGARTDRDALTYRVCDNQESACPPARREIASYQVP